MAWKDVDPGIKVLVGLVAFSLLLAMLSDGDPDNDAWGGGTAEASGSDEPDAKSAEDAYDPWTAGPGGRPSGDGGGVDGGRSGLPVCDDTALFSADGGVVRLPVRGPSVPFPSPACVIDGRAAAPEAIGVVQHALAGCHGLDVDADGRYGPETRRAVRAVQERGGVTVDGVYGPETLSVMGWPLEPDGDDADASCAEAPDV